MPKGFQPGNNLGIGRPKAHHTVQAEKAKAYIIKRVLTELQPIVSKAIEQAKEGDKSAREWLSDRAFGRPNNSLDISNPGELEAIKDSNKLIKELIDSTKNDS